MLKTLFKGKSNLQCIIKNQMRNNHNNLNKLLDSTTLERLRLSQINSEGREYIEKYILTTQISTIFGATGGVIIYGGEALLKNIEKDFLVHFIETLKGTTLGFIYGVWIGFFWPVTASVLIIRFGHLSLKTQSKNFSEMRFAF